MAEKHENILKSARKLLILNGMLHNVDKCQDDLAIQGTTYGQNS